ncbi:MAG: von Willebrand factor type A domain-containing protein [Planctomycetaceae bacterium]|jgi:secreted protein with Ig-like and vWFA domain|nr:von Willebrand factor type A domain-containing protein [Planctomycetaceae bacterium]
MTITISDPKLTAFVLGELPDDEMQEIQSAINADAELLAEIEAIRQTVQEIETAMKNEPLPADKMLTVKPKPRKWFVRIAAAAVAASLFIAALVPLLPPSKETAVAKHVIGVSNDAIDAVDKKEDVAMYVFGVSNDAIDAVDKKKDVDSSSRQKDDMLLSFARKLPPQNTPNTPQSRVEFSKTLDNASEVSEMSRFMFNRGVLRDEKVPLDNSIADEGKSPRDVYNSANAEAYKEFTENEFKAVKAGEFSTFSIDVDSASYTAMRRYINERSQRPPVESVRLEEYVNYFKYGYAQPTDGKPFAAHVDVSPCPWKPKHLLARIGIKGKEYSAEERPPLNLVFLIDVSGSMEASNRLPLVKRGLTELVEMLQAKDRVAIVTYAGASRIALPSVSGQEKQAILDSINALGAGGSTAGAAGIKTAYEVARKYYDKKAQNRVILCTDGDFNVGETNNKTLEEMIGDEAKSGVFLTILGFGMGNYKDDRLKTLSMRGNGNYGYIDTIDEARRLLVEGLTGTLFAIAKDVKIQVDFNPAKIAGYRLLGYENRKLRDEDFHNDKVDAGEIGAGHTVTALYEIVPAGESLPAIVDKSRYGNEPKNSPEVPLDASSTYSDELMFVKLRYKEPDGDKSSLLEYPVTAKSTAMSADSQFAAAVALYGMLLRNSRHSGSGTYDMVLELAAPSVKDDSHRKEFVELVKKAKGLR